MSILLVCNLHKYLLSLNSLKIARFEWFNLEYNFNYKLPHKNTSKNTNGITRVLVLIQEASAS